MDPKEIQKNIDIIIRDKYRDSSPSQASLIHDIERLMTGEPVDYVIGWKPFLGAHIDLSCKPLIPRVETEYWSEIAITSLKTRFSGNANITILDLFCGSGCVGFSMLMHIPNAHVDFADKNSLYKKQIEITGEINKISNDRYRFLNSDIFSGISGVYDCVVANPPYISYSRKESLDESVKNFEPAEALFAEDDGRALIGSFLQELPNHLAPQGICFMEFGEGQAQFITQFPLPDTFRIRIGDDQYGVPRFAIIERFA